MLKEVVVDLSGIILPEEKQDPRLEVFRGEPVNDTPDVSYRIEFNVDNVLTDTGHLSGTGDSGVEQDHIRGVKATMAAIMKRVNHNRIRENLIMVWASRWMGSDVWGFIDNSIKHLEHRTSDVWWVDSRLKLTVLPFGEHVADLDAM
tara:strand:- start:41877 stop:42317 length:441 start_codon:yes stop_codon:yes gene_type:complete